MFISEKIAQARKQNNLTQRELAEKLNVSDKVISKWETGKSLPDVETMLRLSKALGVSISELYDCIDEPSEQIIETDSEERVWVYKKYSIISCVLLVLSPILFLLAEVEWSGNSTLRDIFEFILIVSSILTLAVGLAMQISQFIKLYSFSKTKFYQKKYKSALKKYAIISIICALMPVYLIIGYFIVFLFD